MRQLFGKLRELVRIGNQPVIVLHRLYGLVVTGSVFLLQRHIGGLRGSRRNNLLSLADERLEFKFIEESRDLIVVRAFLLKRVEVDAERNVGLYRDQPFREKSHILPVPELFPEGGFVDFLRVRENLFHRAILLNEGYRGLLPDSLDPRYVVHGVPSKREDVYNLRRLHAELLLHPLLIDDFELHSAPPRPVHLHFGRDELHEVLVACNHENPDAFFRGQPGERADHIVRFVPRLFHRRHTESVQHLLNASELSRHLLRHLLTRSLILRILLVTKRRLGSVEDRHQVIRSFIADDLHEIIGEPKDGACVLSSRIDERMAYHGEIGPVCQSGSIKDEKAF